MRAINQPPTDDEFLLAVEMRANGKAWKHVGEALNRAEDTVRKWPKRYEQRWEEAESRAEMRTAIEGAAEAVCALRVDLRSKKEYAGQAKALLVYRVGLGALKLREWLAGFRGQTDERTNREAEIARYFRSLRTDLGVTLCRDFEGGEEVDLSPAERVKRAEEDPASFIAFALTDSAGIPLARSRLHDDLHAFLSEHRKALVELPRDHGKTVQVCGRILWELGRDPSLRVKLVCASDGLAAERSRFLRDAIASNPRVRLVFPHLTPAQPWTAEAFTVPRPAAIIGPSVAAFGVGAASTGTRADLLVCDDIVDVRSLHCPGERRRVRDYFHNNLMNLLEPDKRFWGLCTPWHPDDLNAHLKQSGQYPLFRRAVGPDCEPVWAAKWDRPQLLERKAEIGEASFARGYRLVTVSEGELVIRPEWVQFWDGEFDRGRYEAVVLAVDPAVSTKATADRSALVVAGLVCSHVHILHASAIRVNTPVLVEQMAALDALWRPDVIRFESNAAFAGIRDMLKQQTTFGPKVVGQAETKSKDSRLAALSVAVQSGCVRLKGQGGAVDPSQREVFDELTSYPFGPHDDLADATAAAVAHLLNRPTPRVWV